MTKRRRVPEHQARHDFAPVVAHPVPGAASSSPREYLQNASNRMIGQLLQAKLKVGAAQDAAEQEADRIAEQVTNTPQPAKGQQVRGNAAENIIQAKPSPGAPAAAASVQAPGNDGLRGGEPVSSDVRRYFEPRMGATFENVRVHRGPEAAQAAHSLHAQAFTTGENIVFGAGKYAPETESGRRLLAHELTHVVQQRRGADAVIRRQPETAGLPPVPPPPRLRLPRLGESLTQPREPLLPVPQLGFHLLPEDRTRITQFLDQHLTVVAGAPALDGLPTNIPAIVDAVLPMLLPLVPRTEVEEFVTTYWNHRVAIDILHPPGLFGTGRPGTSLRFDTGPGSTVPPLRLPRLGDSLALPRTPSFQIPRLGFHLLPADRTQIRAYLAEHLTVGPGGRPVLDGFVTTIPAVVDAIMPLLLPVVPRNEAEETVRTYWGEQLAQAILRAPPELPSVSVPSPTLTFTAGVNLAAHINLTPGPAQPCRLTSSTTSCDATLQLQIGEEASLQRIFQISYNMNTGQVQVVAGGQATADLDIVKNVLKLSGFVQIVAGVAWTGNPASGMFSVLQPSAGAQLTLTWRRVQFFAQVAPSVTAVQGQPVTGDINATLGITVPLGRSPRREPRTPSTELTSVFEIRDWVESTGYSELERLPTDEKTRLISILLGRDTVIAFDAEAVLRIWNSIESGMEQREVRQFIEARLPQISNQSLQDRLRGEITPRR
jgi:hypothetical protein